MEERRTARVAELIREELSRILSFEIHDPRLHGVTIASVRVSPDGREAHIQAALYADQDETLAALEKARGHLRHELASRLKLRHVPELFFSTDTGTEAISRVEQLLQRVRKNPRAS